MTVQHVRNATMIIESGQEVILIDPMLGKKGSGLPFTLFRFKPKRNPLVDLPSNLELLNKVTLCMITHLHPDHLDPAAETFLKTKNIPIICNKKDEQALKKRGLRIHSSVDYWQKISYNQLEITGIPAVHGYGFIAKPMGEVMGYFINPLQDSSIYISADTVLTDDVKKALQTLQPKISVVAGGTAQLDFGQPLLMRLNDIVAFAKLAPHHVIVNHVEALNHCPTTRATLQATFQQHALLPKVYIPNDGDLKTY